MSEKKSFLQNVCMYVWRHHWGENYSSEASGEQWWGGGDAGQAEVGYRCVLFLILIFLTIIEVLLYYHSITERVEKCLPVLGTVYSEFNQPSFGLFRQSLFTIEIK